MLASSTVRTHGFPMANDGAAAALSAQGAHGSPTSGKPRDALLVQAAKARQLGSAFVEQMLEAAWRQLDAAPVLAARIDGWALDPGQSALALRLNAGLHALARSGTCPRLSALYEAGEGDFDGAVHEALSLCEPILLGWLDRPTQTNEVSRAAAFMAALAHLGAGQNMPVELLELGASAGLNLNLHRYRYRLCGQEYGASDSSLSIVPRWLGGAPPLVPVSVIAARGVDLAPVVLTNPAECERLMAYAWRGETRRARLLAKAIAIAHDHPPQVDRGAAGIWLAERLSEPQPNGVRRVIMHSMVMQYVGAEERRAISALMRLAGAGASRNRPLAWVSFEWNPQRSDVLLRLTQWDGHDQGRPRVLAKTHPYGKWIDWLG